nr:TetR/AcrR family transcriptional regulator [Rhodococcus sp. (in: high G+C Gram-positive bacteria)]
MDNNIDHQAPRRKSSGARVPRERLVHAATALFAERGYDAVTIADIAAAAGTTRPTVYKHLGDKYAAYADCVRLAAQEAATFLYHRYEQASALTPREEIAADMQAFFDFAELHPACFSLLMDTSHGPATPHRDAVIEAITNRLTTQIAKRIPASAKGSVPRHLAAMTVGVAILAAREARKDHPADRESAANLAALFVMGGLRELELDHTRTTPPTDVERSRPLPPEEEQQ